ncbi:uncharacterized protein FOKN1_1254 [Thiohalobacter thiocyanaticus]|uniref:DUF302 domain-containing protein n=1 Tax=Thiohalobacter thiocyanaticus TaxID=585455 RepID=A0A1Z4VQ90_9GAMM|nr:DUF302 domain-containing protein [Thiohalobacter thiocyanaticus]BAZ93653.1 uncharacterized protein FOKN1_1254 [Thiohalobacter thiocyanaticus]
MRQMNLLYGFIGLVIGIIMTGVSAYAVMPDLMILEDESRYGFDETVRMMHEETEKQGWSIPVVHDLQETMKNFGKDVRKVKVFELCHPAHAYKILSQDSERIVVSMMPCRVAIYERADNKAYISRMNSALMGKLMGGIVSEVMDDAARESEMIIAPLLK